MKIYLDSEYCCHLKNDGTMREFDLEMFDGKCQTYIEGYRYIPPNESWLRNDGVRFFGETVAPFVEYRLREQAQFNYEKEDLLNALEILGVTE